MNNYTILDIIGEGAYGTVLKASHKTSHIMVAIKKFKQTDDDQLIKKTTVRQIQVLRGLKHKNIVELHEAFRKKGLVHLVFEFLDNNLLEVLERNTHGLAAKALAWYIYQVLEGLQYMHSLGYVHRDIKPENLLVGGDQQLKICDMGFAKILSSQMTDYVATRWYRPPELLVGAKYGPPIDIWAVGCIMAELTDTNPLFPGADEVDQLALIMRCLGDLPDNLQACFQNNKMYRNLSLPKMGRVQTDFSRYRAKLGDKGIDLLKRILVLDPSKRITAAEALKHPFFDIVRPRKVAKQLLKTADSWSNSTAKLPPGENSTDRNTRPPLNFREESKSLQKQNMSRGGSTNGLFKFGARNGTENQLGLLERGMNKIYKRGSQKWRHLIPQVNPRKGDKMASVGHRTNTDFKLSQKRREKSSLLFNV